jgi:hypothetical protein
MTPELRFTMPAVFKSAPVVATEVAAAETPLVTVVVLA